MILLPLFHLPHGLCIRAPGRQGRSSFLFFWCTLPSMQHSVFDPCSSLNAGLPLIIVLRFEFHTLPLGSTKTGAREGGTLWPSPPPSRPWLPPQRPPLPASPGKKTRNRRSNTTSNKKSGSKNSGEAACSAEGHFSRSRGCATSRRRPQHTVGSPKKASFGNVEK